MSSLRVSSVPTKWSDPFLAIPLPPHNPDILKLEIKIDELTSLIKSLTENKNSYGDNQKVFA
ncbi:MAG TPA: hypothetical protein VL996_01665 [Methylocella sp.]|nr:hypothetical protein [Methylocella sp.]